jgi:hypothetical protein
MAPDAYNRVRYEHLAFDKKKQNQWVSVVASKYRRAFINQKVNPLSVIKYYHIIEEQRVSGLFFYKTFGRKSRFFYVSDAF